MNACRKVMFLWNCADVVVYGCDFYAGEVDAVKREIYICCENTCWGNFDDAS